jgi:hypothetical protein
VQAIKAVTGVTPTCWRVRTISSVIIVVSNSIYQPPFGDVDDRIRAIASGLGLRTIIWEHDTFDWEQATGNVTAAQVDTNYQNVIQLAQNGSLSSVYSNHPRVRCTSNVDWPRGEPLSCFMNSIILQCRKPSSSIRS